MCEKKEEKKKGVLVFFRSTNVSEPSSGVELSVSMMNFTSTIVVFRTGV